MIDPKKIKIGSLVRHVQDGYVGTFDRITTLRSLFEKPSDQVGCRVLVKAETKRRIASPDNLELFWQTTEITLEEKHKLMLQRLGLEWKGVRTSSKDKVLSPKRHCYLCKSALDNSSNMECVACGWLLCRCGACGCGYK